MNQEDRTLIDKLFQQLSQAAAQTPERDRDADAYIRRRVQQQPELLYNMVQTLILQQRALQNAKVQVEKLMREKGAAQSPYRAQPQQPARGQSFLSGAAETALGVAGGMFLADAVGSLFDDMDFDLAADAIGDAYDAGLEDGLDMEDDFGFDDFDFDF